MSEPKRIQLRRTKGWRKPDDAIVVSRPSYWGNPYAVGDRVAIVVGNVTISGSEVTVTQDLAVALYRVWLLAQPDEVQRVRDDLAGRDLACWCPLSAPCHGDVLLELANGDLA